MIRWFLRELRIQLWPLILLAVTIVLLSLIHI